jgi:hypothetical protein
MRRLPLLLAAGLAVLLAIAFGSLTINRFSASNSAAAVAKRYFSALSAGDAPAAMALADLAPHDGPFLTSTVLREQLRVAKLEKVKVIRTDQGSAGATVFVSYVLKFAAHEVPVSDQVAMVKAGSSWRLSRAASVVSLSTGAGTDRVTFAGRPLPDRSVEIFPGALPVATDSAAVTVQNSPAVRLADSSAPVSITADLSGAARKQIAGAVDSALAKCLAATSTDPLCPMAAGGRPVPGSLHGTLTKSVADSNPKITLSDKGKGAIDFTASVEVNASWKVWDFNNQEVGKKQTATLELQAVTSVDAPQTVRWVTPNA